MSTEKVLENIVGELLSLSKRKPLRDKDLVRAKELMIKLREMGFTNKEVSNLTYGGWSEPTIKDYTRGTDVVNPGPKKNSINLLTQLVNMNLSLEDVQSSISINSDLVAKGLRVEDVSSLLEEAKKTKVDVKDIIHTYKDIKDSGLTLTQLGEALSYKSDLEKAGFTLDNLKTIHKASKTYGGYNKVLEAVNTFGSLKTIQADVKNLESNKEKLDSKVNKLNSEIKDLKEKKSLIEGFLNLHKELEDLGFDEATLRKLKTSADNFGGVKEVLEAVNTYTNLAELQSKVDDLKKKSIDLESDLKKVQADYAHLQTVIAMCDALLYKYKFSISAITDIYDTAKEYGEPIEVLKAIGRYGEQKTIEKEIERLSSEKGELEVRVRELNSQVQKLRASSEELKNTAEGLLKPFTVDLSKSVKLLNNKFSNAIDTISTKYEEYAEKLGKLKTDAGKLEEELRLARYLQALLRYPSELKDLPQDHSYFIIMLQAFMNYWRVKGVNPKVKAGYSLSNKYFHLSSSNEVELIDLLDWAMRGLTSSLGPA
ncbi:MAG: hypothetical protein L6M37_00910 [Candidatus Methylarchaceae archaeon HK02M1]|nr:hypothetical protein [Candidatus Methylarchaceae archaeon HK02M1]